MKKKNIFGSNWICDCKEMWLMSNKIKMCDKCCGVNRYNKPFNRRGKGRLKTRD